MIQRKNPLKQFQLKVVFFFDSLGRDWCQETWQHVIIGFGKADSYGDFPFLAEFIGIFSFDV